MRYKETKVNCWFGIFFIIISLLLIFIIIPDTVLDIKGFKTSPRLFPQIFSGLIGILGLLFFLNNLKAGEKSEHYNEISGKEVLRVLFTVLLGIAYIVLIKYIGFIVCTVILLFVLISYFGESNFKLTVLIAIFSALVIKGLLQVLLKINLPQGIFLVGDLL